LSTGRIAASLDRLRSHRARRAIDEGLVEEVCSPLAGVGQVPLITAPEFVSPSLAADKSAPAEACNQLTCGLPATPCFPSIHDARITREIGQWLSKGQDLFVDARNRHLTLPGAGS